MLFHDSLFANQTLLLFLILIQICLVAFVLIVGVESDLIFLADQLLLRSLRLLHFADQFPDLLIACIRMDMTLRLFHSATWNGCIAAVTVGMTLRFGQVTQEIGLVAAISVHMGLLRQDTVQNQTAAFFAVGMGLILSQLTYQPAVTPVIVDVGFHRQFTYQNPFPAGSPMGMAPGFFQSTHQIPPGHAHIRMDMSLNFRLFANQFPKGDSIAGILVLMLRLIAVLFVLVFLDLRKQAHQSAIFIIAGVRMLMDHKIRQSANKLLVFITTFFRMFVNFQGVVVACQTGNLPGGKLDIAAVGMGVLLQPTERMFHGDRRKDQSVRGAEHNDTGHHPNDPAPDVLPFILLCILLCHWQQLFLHRYASFP